MVSYFLLFWGDSRCAAVELHKFMSYHCLTIITTGVTILPTQTMHDFPGKSPKSHTNICIKL